MSVALVSTAFVIRLFRYFITGASKASSVSFSTSSSTSRDFISVVSSKINALESNFIFSSVARKSFILKPVRFVM